MNRADALRNWNIGDEVYVVVMSHALQLPSKSHSSVKIQKPLCVFKAIVKNIKKEIHSYNNSISYDITFDATLWRHLLPERYFPAETAPYSRYLPEVEKQVYKEPWKFAEESFYGGDDQSDVYTKTIHMRVSLTSENPRDNTYPDDVFMTEEEANEALKAAQKKFIRTAKTKITNFRSEVEYLHRQIDDYLSKINDLQEMMG